MSATAPAPVRIAVATHGCKANHADSAALTDGLLAALTVPFELVASDAPSDVYVLNTCTVTGAADSDARQSIRRAARTQPGAKILVTGCYAQTDREALRAMPEVTAVVGNVDKALIPEMVARLLRGEDPLEARREGHRSWNPTLRDATAIRRLQQGIDRPFVKVQDGCDYSCSFCIIPVARGASRSRQLHEVIAEVRAYEALGAQEIVLTGIHLGHWGRDLTPRLRFGAMVERLLAATDRARLRISSLEPNEVDDHVLDLVTSHPRVCAHLHVPLQSGDDATLRQMRRVYKTSYYARIIERFRARAPAGAFGADVMVGFPGEDDAAFERSARFIEGLDASYLHVFPFSPRRGTPAAAMPPVPGPAVRDRVRRLMAWSDQHRALHTARSVGSMAKVIVETRAAPDGRLQGYSERYVHVRFPGLAPAGGLETVMIDDADGGQASGHLLSEDLTRVSDET